MIMSKKVSIIIQSTYIGLYQCQPAGGEITLIKVHRTSLSQRKKKQMNHIYHVSKQNTFYEPH